MLRYGYLEVFQRVPWTFEITSQLYLSGAITDPDQTEQADLVQYSSYNLLLCFNIYQSLG